MRKKTTTGRMSKCREENGRKTKHAYEYRWCVSASNTWKDRIERQQLVDLKDTDNFYT